MLGSTQFPKSVFFICSEPKRGDELPMTLLDSGKLGCAVRGCWNLSRVSGEDREEAGNMQD